MEKRPQVSQNFADLYWQSVTAQLRKAGMSETDAALAVMQYRERMKRAGDTIYNDQTSESAMWAKKLFAPPAEMPDADMPQKAGLKKASKEHRTIPGFVGGADGLTNVLPCRAPL